MLPLERFKIRLIKFALACADAGSNRKPLSPGVLSIIEWVSVPCCAHEHTGVDELRQPGRIQDSACLVDDDGCVHLRSPGAS